MGGTLSREHPARATITRMVTPNFMANLLTPRTTAEYSIDDAGCRSHAPLGDSDDNAYGHRWHGVPRGIREKVETRFSGIAA